VTLAVPRPRRAARALAGFCALASAAALAQLKDEPPAERDAMVMASLLPGLYSNGEQRFFDERLKVPAAERAAAMKLTVTRVNRPAGAPPLFVFRQANGPTWAYAATLEAGPAAVQLVAFTVVAGISDGQLATGQTVGLTAVPSCNLISRREAGQFRATALGPCAAGPQELLMTGGSLWWRSSAGGPFARLNRARQFECHVDMPGSGGIRGEVFNRYADLQVDDQGTEAWFTTKEAVPRKLGLRLRNVDWPMNNKAGTFTRDSLTLYLIEDSGDVVPRNLSYAWTEPSARRIGLNTVAILANCYMEAPTMAKPEF